MGNRKNKLVFIVEDNDLYSMILDYTLTNETNVKCIIYRTGEECLKNLNMKPMLIILDYWLPGINGNQTLKEIKKNNQKVPVVMLTRNKDEGIEKELLVNNPFEYLHKEENSIDKIVGIVNYHIDKVDSEEQKKTTIVKLIMIILFFVGTLITLIYIN